MHVHARGELRPDVPEHEGDTVLIVVAHKALLAYVDDVSEHPLSRSVRDRGLASEFVRTSACACTKPENTNPLSSSLSCALGSHLSSGWGAACVSRKTMPGVPLRRLEGGVFISSNSLRRFAIQETKGKCGKTSLRLVPSSYSSVLPCDMALENDPNLPHILNCEPRALDGSVPLSGPPFFSPPPFARPPFVLH